MAADACVEPGRRAFGGSGGRRVATRQMEPAGEKLHLLREEFASVASCDAAVAQHYLAENDWEMEVRCFSFALSLEPRAHEAHSCVSFSEGAELLLRVAGGGGRLKISPRVRAQVLVSGTGGVGQIGVGARPAGTVGGAEQNNPTQRLRV